jgi:predicted AlkP superfamily phosphohydrolase/phosphomutase
MFLGYIDPGTGFVIVNLGGWLLALLVGILGAISFFFKRILRFVKKHKIIAAAILLIIIAGGATFTGVFMKSQRSDFDQKIVILGFDGLSPRIMEPMMAEGHLPNFARLRRQGSYSQLLTTNPAQSPVAWSGFATGQNPGKHGVYDFIIRDPATYGLNLSLSNVEKGKAKKVVKGKSFWQYTSEAGVPTVILGCPVTFPPDKIKGRMLSGMGVPDILGTEGTFSFFTTESEKKDKDIGGKVFHIKKALVMETVLTGPKTATGGGKAENVLVPLKISLPEGGDKITIEFQKNRFDLKEGEWSDWQSVSFKLGFMKKMKGILKFYLVAAEPELKLYAGPINFDPRDPFFPISYPDEYSDELVDEIGLFHTQGLPLDTWALNEKRLTEEPFLTQAGTVFGEKSRILDHELDRFEKGVLFAYFGSSDIIQHMFWRYTDPGHPLYEPDAPEKYRETINTWYRKADAILGKVMDKLGSEATLIVLSDHGFDTFRRAVHVNSWLREKGYLVLKNPKAREGSELLMDVNWHKTRAYSIGFGAIYINQDGREKNGRVKPGRESEDLKGEIIAGLKEWIDEEKQKPVVRNVYNREDIFWGENYEETPDLYIGFEAGYRASWQTAIGGAPEKLVEDNLKKWSGTHLNDPDLNPGILFASREISKESPSIYDIAPTVMALVGYDEAQISQMDLDGSPLF